MARAEGCRRSVYGTAAAERWDEQTRDTDEGSRRTRGRVGGGRSGAGRRGRGHTCGTTDDVGGTPPKTRASGSGRYPVGSQGWDAGGPAEETGFAVRRFPGGVEGRVRSRSTEGNKGRGVWTALSAMPPHDREGPAGWAGPEPLAPWRSAHQHQVVP